MSKVQELLVRAQASLVLIDEINEKAGVTMPLHDAMEFLDAALRAEVATETLALTPALSPTDDRQQEREKASRRLDGRGRGRARGR